MQQALTASLRDPTQCLIFISEVQRRLALDLGVTIEYVPLPGDDLADWHSSNRTFYISSDAALEDQVWAHLELLLLLIVGPEACAGARPMPILHSVPELADDLEQPG